jgi:hypothetical protein
MSEHCVNVWILVVDEIVSGKTEINDAAQRVWCMRRAVNFLSGDPDKL